MTVRDPGMYTSTLDTGLDPGIYTSTLDKPMKGYKVFKHCAVQGTFLDTLFGADREYSTCIAEVTVTNGKDYIVPKNDKNDIRTNGYHVGDIETMDGKKCIYAKSPILDMWYTPNVTYTSELNYDLEKTCVQGLHFYPSKEIMLKKEWIDNFSYRTYHKKKK